MRTKLDIKDDRREQLTLYERWGALHGEVAILIKNYWNNLFENRND